MLLNLIHSRLATSVILYLIALIIWAFWRFFKKEGMNANYRGALIISAMLILVQGLLGGIMWVQGIRPDRGGMHLLYGILGVLGIPAVFLFIRDRQNRYEMLVIGTAFLCLIAIIFRSVATG